MQFTRFVHLIGPSAVLAGACGGLVSSSVASDAGTAVEASAGAAGGAGNDGGGAAGTSGATAGAGNDGGGAAGTSGATGGAGNDGGGAAGDSGAAGGAGSDGAAGAGAVAGGIPGISCEGAGTGLRDCGPESENCCTRPLVTGGKFYRDYDAVVSVDKSYPATISDFRLDKYEITVGRFRNFVAAWDAGWRPAAGDGKHAHLNGGKGLVSSLPAGGYETGWRPEWSSLIPATRSDWDTKMLGAGCGHNWTADDSSDGRYVVACVTWYESHAFCIWDGGFLPSDAEWNYAAAGGDEQRVYPWSSPPASTDIDCTRAHFAWQGQCGDGDFTDPAGARPPGDARWGQADLAGNAMERVLDGWFYDQACIDCASGTPDDNVNRDGRSRGGGYASSAWGLVNSLPHGMSPDSRSTALGARCAYSP